MSQSQKPVTINVYCTDSGSVGIPKRRKIPAPKKTVNPFGESPDLLPTPAPTPTPPSLSKPPTPFVPRRKRIPVPSLNPRTSLVGALCLVAASIVISPEASDAWDRVVFEGDFTPVSSLKQGNPAIAETAEGQALRSRVTGRASQYKDQRLNLIHWSNAQCAAFVRFVFESEGIDLPITIEPLDGLPLEGNSPFLASRFLESEQVVRASLAGKDIGYLVREIDDLEPGDIVFWTCTYGDWCRQHGRPIITHTEIFLGDGMIAGDRSGVTRVSIMREIFKDEQFFVAVRPDWDLFAQQQRGMMANTIKDLGSSLFIVSLTFVLILWILGGDDDSN